MQILEHDESWPYIEHLTPARATDQLEKLDRLPLVHSLGLRLEKMATDYTRVSISPGPESARRRRMLQGGVLAALVDAAARQALRTTLKLEHEAVTIHLDTKYFRPAYEERVFAEGSVVRKGRDLAHIDVAVINEDGTLVARGWCVLKITRRHEPQTPETELRTPGCEALEGELGI